MSWASRRRTTYVSAIVLFFAVVIGGPVAYHFLTIPPTCFDGTQNQGETAVDEGGPCLKLDPSTLQPHAILWARSFKVRDGTYTAAAYIENPNKDAGAEEVAYHFGLYDAGNVLVAERTGTTFIMPGAITPVVESRIDTGNRTVAHTYFQFTSPLIWERMGNAALAIEVNNKQLTNADSAPRLSANVQNNSVADILNPAFAAIVFDPSGNAFAASATLLGRLSAGASATVVFTWPDAFPATAGRIDILPLVPPVPMSAPQQ